MLGDSEGSHWESECAERLAEADFASEAMSISFGLYRIKHPARFAVPPKREEFARHAATSWRFSRYPLWVMTSRPRHVG